MPTYRHCRACGTYKGPKGGGYCEKEECREIARQNMARSPAKIAATRERLHRQWEEWKRQGINPTTTPEINVTRRKGVSRSNRQQPKRRPEEHEGLTIREAAERLGLAYDGVMSRIRRGTLQAHKSGSVWLIDPKDIEGGENGSDRQAAEDR